MASANASSTGSPEAKPREADLPGELSASIAGPTKGRATAFSDIDLLVVYDGPPRDNAYKVVRRSLNLRGLEPHVYAEAEAAGLQPTLDRMIRDGIDLM